jgi:hypothetical protein
MSMRDARALLDRSPRLQALFGGGADPAWLNTPASERGPEPSIPVAELVPETPEQALGRYMIEALCRAEAWCMWHYDRAARRRLDDGMVTMGRTAGLVGSLRRATESRGIRSGLTWVALAAYRAAFDEADREHTKSGYSENAMDQLVEVETSHLRTLLNWTALRIADSAWQLSKGLMTGAEAQIYAAETLAYAPGYPQEADDTDAD